MQFASHVDEMRTRTLSATIRASLNTQHQPVLAGLAFSASAQMQALQSLFTCDGP